MKAIKLKLISFTKIDGKDDEGPEFRVEIGKSNFDVKINAKVTVLGVSAGATITVTEKEYSFKIEGRMFDVFKAELHCRAAYGDLKSAEFSVSCDSIMSPFRFNFSRHSNGCLKFRGEDPYCCIWRILFFCNH